jgi:predicted lactoylglutathione lyase
VPPWFHFGFRLDSGAAVVSQCDRMQERGVTIVKPLYQDGTLVSYRCADPDGHAIEVYWEARDAPLD